MHRCRIRRWRGLIRPTILDPMYAIDRDVRALVGRLKGRPRPGADATVVKRNDVGSAATRLDPTYDLVIRPTLAARSRRHGRSATA
jgi:hypothetical protein